MSVNVEMPEGLKKMVVGHSANMDTEGTYSHKEKGDMEKAADFTDSAFNEILNSQKTLKCVLPCVLQIK